MIIVLCWLRSFMIVMLFKEVYSLYNYILDCSDLFISNLISTSISIIILTF